MVVLKPNVVRGGRAIGLGNNFYLMKGRTHSKGGIDIGKNPKTGLEVENNEVMQVSPKGVRVFSAQPILGGISPAQYILGGANPNQVFNAQEQWKKVNKINDDGSKKARFGDEEKSTKQILKENKDIKPYLVEYRNASEYTEDFAEQRNLRYDPNAKDVKDFFKSYINSEGFDRIIKNQENWYNKRYPNRSKVFPVNTDKLKENFKRNIENDKTRIFNFNDHPERSQWFDRVDVIFRTTFPGDKEEEGISNDFILGHEYGHSKDKGTYTNGQKRALELNINVEKNKHDERKDEKHSDVWGLKYLLYKQGIYDSRGKKDATREDISKLRKLYPELRIFKQFEKDDDLANYINIIADNRKTDFSNKMKYGGIHIKPSKRGTFTAAAKKHGMSVQGFASKVLANKGKYSSAMVKKANFARNASKWKHKEFGGDMDFNYWITKDNIYKLGGRKKALNGADYLKLLWNEDNTPTLKFSGLNVDIPKVPTLSYSQRNNRSISNPIQERAKRDKIGLDISNESQRIINDALKNNSRLSEPSLQNTINKMDAVRSIASNQPAIKTNNSLDIGNIGNLIGTGINIAGNLISYGINNRALNRMRRPSMPLPLRAENLQTRVSTAAQEAAIRENVAGQEGLISGNLASSRSRLNAINRVRNQGTSMYNQLQDRKQNIETELINRNKLNRQQIGNQNVLQFNNWRDRVTEFDNKITDLRSENGVNLTQGIADAIAGERGYLANRENDARYRMNAFLTTIANPDAFNAMNSTEIRRLARQFGITNRQLKDLGINV